MEDKKIYPRHEGGNHLFEGVVDQDIDFGVVLLLQTEEEKRRGTKSNIYFIIFRKLKAHKEREHDSFTSQNNSIVCAVKRQKEKPTTLGMNIQSSHTYTKTHTHTPPNTARREKPSHPCNAAELSS